MPDITKCTNEDCISNTTCFRYTSNPSPFNQSYARFTPTGNVGECEKYIQDVESIKLSQEIYGLDGKQRRRNKRKQKRKSI